MHQPATPLELTRSFGSLFCLRVRLAATWLPRACSNPNRRPVQTGPKLRDSNPSAKSLITGETIWRRASCVGSRARRYWSARCRNSLEGQAQVRTETFTLLAICEWFNVLNCRSDTKSALTLAVFRNRWLVGGLVIGNLLQVAVVFWEPLGSVFHTVPFGLDVAVALALVGSLLLWVEELRKLVVRRRLRRATTAR